MWCPKCGSETTRVVGTEKSSVVERFRKCRECAHVFATIETVKFDAQWQKDAQFTAQERARIMKKYHKNQRSLFNEQKK